MFERYANVYADDVLAQHAQYIENDRGLTESENGNSCCSWCKEDPVETEWWWTSTESRKLMRVSDAQENDLRSQLIQLMYELGHRGANQDVTHREMTELGEFIVHEWMEKAVARFSDWLSYQMQ